MAFEIYDDDAFVHFLLTLFSLTLLPLSLFKLYSFFKPGKLPQKCSCNLCQGTLKKKHVTPKSRVIFKFILYSFLWISYLRIAVLVYSNKKSETKIFDPFEILGLQKDSSSSQIKRRYYDLSLALHPDKIKKKNAETEKRYVLIKKAYQSLTDPTAKENYAKHGHPDGHQGMKITIGLPSFLSGEQNEALVLLCYMISGLVLAATVFYWWRRTKKFRIDGIYTTSVNGLVMNVQENSGYQNFIEMMCVAEEFEKFESIQPSEFETLFQKAKKHIRLSNSNYRNFINYVWTIMVNHLTNAEIPESLSNDHIYILETLFKLIPVYCVTLSDIETWRQKVIIKYHKDPLLYKRVSAAKVPLKPIKSLFEFSQKICQRQSLHADELEQIPFLTSSTIRSLKRLKITNLNNFLSTFSSVKEETDTTEIENGKEKKRPKIMTKNGKIWKTVADSMREHISGLEAFTSNISHLDIDLSSASKEDSNTVCEGEDLRLKVKVCRRKRNPQFFPKENTETEKEKNSSKTDVDESRGERTTEKVICHCPGIPVEKEERWALLILDKTQQEILHFRWLNFTQLRSNSTCEFEVKLPQKVGSRKRGVVALALSDCYVGLEFKGEFEYDVVRNEEESDEEDFVEIEDEKEKSLFEFTWCDIVFLPFFLVGIALILPETNLGVYLTVKWNLLRNWLRY